MIKQKSPEVHLGGFGFYAYGVVVCFCSEKPNIMPS